jgi:hypothetical protein
MKISRRKEERHCLRDPIGLLPKLIARNPLLSRLSRTSPLSMSPELSGYPCPVSVDWTGTKSESASRAPLRATNRLHPSTERGSCYLRGADFPALRPVTSTTRFALNRRLVRVFHTKPDFGNAALYRK